MAITTVGDLIENRIKTTLQENSAEGVRWQNAELLGWLNESYQMIVSIRPDANPVNDDITLIEGTKQSIPTAGTRLLGVMRCTHPDSNMGVIQVCERATIDATRPGWHAEDKTRDIEYFIYDELDPTRFYIYPPALSGATIEALWTQVPTPHEDYAKAEVIKLDDSYAPAIVDWVLYRAYLKDADFSANSQRAAGHYQAFNHAMGQKHKLDYAVSPNTPTQ